MANNRRGGRNKLVVPGAEDYIERFKNEIAAELGVQNYDQIDKGALPARVHGMIGGTMTKRLIEMGQQMLAGQDPMKSNLNTGQYVHEMQQEIAQNIGNSYANAPVVPTSENAQYVAQGTDQLEQHVQQGAQTDAPEVAAQALPNPEYTETVLH